ncbi:methyl-accepting chemotaxis sensory transducer [Candidatus Moduliflexus flocculans]|uniref:Methyl-accepting chemotaxis sensory transducer n=1 Tax=Candidatus Moduliflexus flocculans TaxID=1499966 RepID=A0A0S6VYF4_9BACT|nr:methyl-accepting chemotaxis sensory transducer [Candidatus Moduliflexus flocculans]
MKIATKLSTAFLTLILIIVGMVISSIFFSVRIQYLSGKIAPVAKTASSLVMCIKDATILLEGLPTLKDEEQLQAQAVQIDELHNDIRQILNELSAVTEAASLDLDVRTITRLHQTFFLEVNANLATYQEALSLQKEAAIAKTLERFQEQQHELNQLLVLFAERNETPIHQKEETARTLEQSGKATTDELLCLIIELFNQDYPLVQGASKLQSYVVELGELCRRYISEQNEQRLAEIEIQIATIFSLADSRVKRLQRCATSTENAHDTQMFAEGLAALQETIMAENGLLALYRKELLVRNRLRELETQIRNVTGVIQSISIDILKRMEQFIETAQKTVWREVIILHIMFGIFMLAGIVISVICAWLMTRSIVQPIRHIVEVAAHVAEGRLDQEITIQRDDEIGQLAEAFRHMQRTLAQVLQETERLSRAVHDGQLDFRGNAESYAGSWQALVRGMNNIIEAFVAPFTMTADSIQRIAKGDIPEKLTTTYRGDFNAMMQNVNRLIDVMQSITGLAEEIADGNFAADVQERSHNDRLMRALNRMTQRLREVLLRMRDLVEMVQQGRLDVRGDTEAFAGGWQDLVVGINALLDAFAHPITSAAAHIDRIARGDISLRITEEYNGDFNAINDNLNILIDAMFEISELAETMANGNLHIEIRERSPQDMLAQALNSMLQCLQQVIINVTSTANHVALFSREMNAASEQVAQGVSKHAASVEELSVTMEQMGMNIKQNAENALQTETIALQAAQDAEASGHAVMETVTAMRDITTHIQILEEIAEQSNLLALNAAIIAAQTGEHGRGFAVVADEVRELAKRSQSAAKEIDKLAVSSVRVAENAGKMLNALVPDIHRTAKLVQKISAANKEHDTGIHLINQTIQQLQMITQKNSANAEKMAVMASGLARQATELNETVAFFTSATAT